MQMDFQGMTVTAILPDQDSNLVMVVSPPLAPGYGEPDIRRGCDVLARMSLSPQVYVNLSNEFDPGTSATAGHGHLPYRQLSEEEVNLRLHDIFQRLTTGDS
jgi:hypothetical protein